MTVCNIVPLGVLFRCPTEQGELYPIAGQNVQKLPILLFLPHKYQVTLRKKELPFVKRVPLVAIVPQGHHFGTFFSLSANINFPILEIKEGKFQTRILLLPILLDEKLSKMVEQWMSINYLRPWSLDSLSGRSTDELTKLRWKKNWSLIGKI